MTRRFAVVISIVLILHVLGATSRSADNTYTLQDAYQAALTNNENVKIAEESVIQSDARIDQAWTYLYPRLVADGAYTRFNETLPPGGGSFIFQPLQQLQASLLLSQPLYTGGRTLAALRTARKMRESSVSDLSFVKQDMLLSVAEAYYGVLKARKAVTISERSLERMEHHKVITEQEATTRPTKANQSSLLRANALVTQARISVVRARDSLRIAREKLGLLTKLPADAEPVEPTELFAPQQSLADLQTEAIMNRADYATSRVNTAIAEENVSIVKGGHYPQLAAVAGLTYQTSDPATALDATVYYGGIQLQVPLFEGGLMQHEVSEAKSKVRQAQLASDFLRKSIESEVYEAYVNLQTLTNVLETAQLQMEYAEGNFKAVEGMFSEGLLASLSLIDAEQTLTAAEREVSNAGYDRQVAILRLDRAVGKLGKDASSR